MQDTRTSRTFVQDSERSSKREERTLAREVDVRPETSGRSSSMQNGRSSRRQKSGRSSRVEARANARPSQAGARPRERTFVQERGRSSRRTLVQIREGEDARPRQRTLVQPGRSGRSSSQAEDARPSCREDARPSQTRGTLVHAEETRGRSSMQKRMLVHAEEDARQRSGRSSKIRGHSSSEIRGRSSSETRRGRSSTQDARQWTLGSEKWTFVHFQLPESFTPGREKWGARAQLFASFEYFPRVSRPGATFTDVADSLFNPETRRVWGLWSFGGAISRLELMEGVRSLWEHLLLFLWVSFFIHLPRL
ncbi:hypothetical protein LR48_Vigan10g214600 [Vigna angularis]|uniref:Uncharacterized protein n=1 Tax=Phaseolus angularis TaxID=3914 RepID=A0A0L9VNC3_PHAAN|nr:hypothetical protein LR48_Vigan10g214600 [Vigna angularis]